MYRSALTLTFGTLLAVALMCAGLALAATYGARYQQERTRLAHMVLELHLELDVKAHTLFEELTDSPQPDEQDRELRRAIFDQFDLLRSAIADEVAFVRQREDESEELDRLALIERRLQRVLDRFQDTQEGAPYAVPVPIEDLLRRQIDAEFHQLMAAAVQEERREVAAAEEQARAWLAWVDRLSRGAALAALVIGLGSLVVLRRRLDRPLLELSRAADRVAEGDFAYRIPVTSLDEFGRLGESFNRMTAQIAAGQAAAQAAKADLEVAVAARTAELGDANAELRRADEQRRRFLADVSHELRSPLAAIRGEADVTLRAREAQEEDYRTALARISEQAELSAALVDDLLFMARTEGGLPRLRLQPVSLPDVVRRAAADIATLAREQGIRLEVQADDTVETIQGDPGRLRQLVTIFLDNAIRYSRAGGMVEVLVGAGPAGVVLQVKDHGIGIPEEEIGRIFNRFYRGSVGSETWKGGSGLGLAMASAIVKAHGGTIAVDSLPDEGSTFGVVFPSARRMQVVK